MSEIYLNHNWDIVLIGGGLVGASFCHAVAKLGLKILVIDRMPAEQLYTAELDNRGLALSYSSKQTLVNIGLWQHLQSIAHPIRQVHVSEQGAFGFTRLAATDYKLPALGYVVSASGLGAALVQSLNRITNVQQLRPATVTKLEFDTYANLWQLQGENFAVTCKLLIAADGSNSIVRQQLNIPLNEYEYAQSAIVTNLEIESTTLTTAYERFVQDEVLAILPFGARQVKCVLTVPNEKLTGCMQLSDQQFLHLIQSKFGHRLGKFLRVQERKSFPISSNFSQTLVGRQAVLLGNAANTLHPVAAQGFNLGLRDAVTLAEIIAHKLHLNRDLDVPAVLDQYAQARSNDHAKTRKFTNSLVKIFANDLPVIKHARRFGLFAANVTPLLKRRIIARGLGVWTQ